MNNESQVLIESIKKLENDNNARNQEMSENIEELHAVLEESNKKENELHQLLNESKMIAKQAIQELEDCKKAR